MQSDYSREKLVAQLHQEWLDEVSSIIEGKLNSDSEDLANLLQDTSDGIESGETEKALKSLTDKLQSKLPKKNENENLDLNVGWIQAFKELTDGIPSEVELPQQEERFNASESDSVWIKTGKLVKRISRSTSSFGTSAGNSIRGIFGGEKNNPPVWSHKVPLKNIIDFNILGLSDWVYSWNNELRKLESEILLEADAWMLHSSGLITFEKDKKKDGEETEGEEFVDTKPAEITPTEADIATFFEEALRKLNSLKDDFQVRLNSDLNEIGDKIEECISKAGTFELSEGDYSQEKISQKEKSVAAMTQSNAAIWAELFAVLVDRVSLSMNFMHLHERVQERVKGFSSSIDEFFEMTMEGPAEVLMQQLEKAITVFNESENRSLKEIRDFSTKHLDDMNEHIEQKMIQPLGEFMEEAILSTKLDRFTAAIPEWTKGQPEKVILVEELDMTKLPPDFEFESVDWQVLVQRVMNNQIAKEFIPKQVKPEEFLANVVKEIQEISQIVFTNLEIADEVKKSDEEEPFEVAKEGLERARVKLDELIQKIHAKRTGLATRLSDQREVAFTKLAMLLEKQDVNEVRMAGAEFMAKETAIDWKTKFQVQWAIISEKAELVGRFIWKKAKLYFQNVRKFLGFAEKEKLEGDKTDLATFLSETDEKIAGLPFIYRRLFDFKKEVDDRFYIRKPEQFERFKKGYELWQNNFPSTLAIVGEKGSGKSLFTRILIQEVLTKNDVIEINFKDTVWKPEKLVSEISNALKIDDVETIEELIAAIKRKKKRVVIILENVQNCYLRNISGFEAIEQLMLLISETNKEVMWITTTTRYGWLFLDRVLNVSDYFTHTVESDNLVEEQIEQVILKRHRASGYQLHFLADENTKKSRTFKKLMGDEKKTQEFLQERYFEKMAKLAEGNSSIAMIFWIRSISEYDDTHFYINPFSFNTITRIDELDSAELFALAAFVLHDSLLPEELAEIMHQPLRNSKLMVSRLASRSILYNTDHGYMLNQLIYRQVVRVLKEANYIH